VGTLGGLEGIADFVSFSLSLSLSLARAIIATNDSPQSSERRDASNGTGMVDKRSTFR